MTTRQGIIQDIKTAVQDLNERVALASARYNISTEFLLDNVHDDYATYQTIRAIITDEKR